MRSLILLAVVLSLCGCDAAFHECEDGDGVANNLTCAAIDVVAVPVLVVASPVLLITGNFPSSQYDTPARESSEPDAGAATSEPELDLREGGASAPDPVLAP